MILKHDLDLVEIWSKNLTKIYGKGETKLEAVSKINLNVKPGIHGFLGPNGAGKTTTINMLIGALSITSGEAKIRGKKAGSVAARRMIGFLPQDPKLYKNMTGEKYLVYIGRLGGLKRKEAKKTAQELLQDFNLLSDRNKKLGKYSGGMRQKIALAGAMIHNPEILILDEPTTNLDAVGRAAMIEKIKDLGKKKSVFVSSHVLFEIEQICELVSIIKQGKIILTDSIKNLKKRFLENVFVLDTNMNEKLLEQLKKEEFVSNVWIDDKDGKLRIVPKNPEILRESMSKIIFENKVELIRFEQLELSLQDIFLKLVG